MLEIRIKLSSAFEVLCSNNPELRRFQVTEEEWNTLKLVSRYLKHFKSFSDILSGEKYVTLPFVVVGVNMLLDKY